MKSACSRLWVLAAGPFSSLVLLESLFLTFTGGLAGLALAWLLAGGVGVAIKDYFPAFHIGAATFVVGISLMLVFGLVTGAVAGAHRDASENRRRAASYLR